MNRTPRVLVVSFSVVPGPDRHGVQLGHVLRALGSRFEVDALTLRSGDLPFVERLEGTRMLRASLPPGPLSGQIEGFGRAVARQLEGAEYDVVHVRGAFEARPALEWAAESDAHVVFDLARSIDGGARPEDPALAARWTEAERYALQRAELVLVPSEVARRALRERGIVAPVEVVPAGVDVDLFDVQPREPSMYQTAPAAAGAPSASGTASPASAEDEGPPVVLCAGTLAPGRGARLLLRAMEMVLPRHPARLVLAGPIEPGFEEPLRRAIEATGLEKHCTLMGPVRHTDLPRLLCSATLCVAPATPEAPERPLAGLPTKILEYLACRRAVIAPRSPGLRDLIVHGEQGLLFRRGSVGELASAVSRLLADPLLRERLAAEGYHAVRRSHAASATRRRLLEAYATLIPPARWRPIARDDRPMGSPAADPNTTTARRLLQAIEGQRAEDAEGAGGAASAKAADRVANEPPTGAASEDSVTEVEPRDEPTGRPRRRRPPR
jgi:glycosyltransferase involved in cell wall biosynthesis